MRYIENIKVNYGGAILEHLFYTRTILEDKTPDCS